MKTSPYWAAVSILYEANEVCNDGEDGHVEVPGQVSILYEANEVCNEGGW